MHRGITFISLFICLLILTACGEKAPDVKWELTIDGDVDQAVTLSYQDILKIRREKLTDVPTQNPQNEDERTSWEGAFLTLLFRKTGKVEYDIRWQAVITFADGTSRRFSLADLVGAMLAVKDGEGNWLAETDEAPLRLVIPNKPSSDWLAGPVRINVQKP
jgi:hypothetical protein